MKKFLLPLAITLCLVSCSTRKEIVYFQNVEKIENYRVQEAFEPVFEVNDILRINVSSINEEVVAPFQMNSGNQSQSGGGQESLSQKGYLVDINGDIQFPVLGKVEVLGKSRSELEELLTEKIQAYVTDAVVAVRLVNFRVVVLGEAGSETVVKVENERISIPELLATVGGVSYHGKRQNIMIIREVNGIKSVGYVNMTDADVFQNPYFYLRQNDIVYVEPTYRTVKSAGFITSWQGLVSIATTALSLIILFTR
jgi:polysaccharide biosynthesis/export protein